MFLENKYTKWYLELMETRKGLMRECYTEKHHIIPSSLGGADCWSNMVHLTAREHFIAHLLLPKMLEGKAKCTMQYALNMMRGKGARQEIYIPSSKIYEILRKAASECQRSRKVSKETRVKMSAAQKRRPPPSDATKLKISKSHTGKKLSAEHIEKLRLTSTGRKHPPRSEQWKQLQRESHLGLKDPNNPNRVAAHIGAKNPRAKIWNLEREDGSIFQVVALKTWCRENGLNFDSITRTKKTRKFISGLRLTIDAITSLHADGRGSTRETHRCLMESG